MVVALDKDVEAQDAAAALDDAECKGHGADWTRAEHAYRAARNPDDAEAAAWVVLTLCAACPVAELCTEWAEVDRYTGLAAGSVYTDGVARPPWQHLWSRVRNDGARMSA